MTVKIFTLIFTMLVVLHVETQAQKNSLQYEAKALRGKERKSLGGSNGIVRFRIFSFGKSYSQLQQENVFLRDALHAILFVGVSNETHSVDPLVKTGISDWSAKEKAFWRRFFAVKTLDSWKKDKKNSHLTENYKRFVTLDGSPNPDDVMQYGKQRKIGVPVSVKRDDLRSYLKREGIL